MKSSDIKLETPSKMFEYEKISRELDETIDVELLREIAKCQLKLHMKQQETIAKLGLPTDTGIPTDD